MKWRYKVLIMILGAAPFLLVGLSETFPNTIALTNDAKFYWYMMGFLSFVGGLIVVSGEHHA